eukprot:scaffold4178_cov257-Pinguiococcus_pyrenoidosus.AAC.2
MAAVDYQSTQVRQWFVWVARLQRPEASGDSIPAKDSIHLGRTGRTGLSEGKSSEQTSASQRHAACCFASLRFNSLCEHFATEIDACPGHPPIA